MSDYLKSQFIITYQRETPPEAYKLMNSVHNDIASSYESGEKTLQVGDKDISIVSNATNFYFMSSKPITVTLSDGKEFIKTQQLAYSGDAPVSVSVSNTDTIAVRIIYAAGTKSE